MVLDLKIEIFAYTLFYNTWIRMDVVKTKPEILQIFGEECCKVENCMEACDKLFDVAVLCRRKVFRKIYLADITDEKIKSFKSMSDCYDYVTSTCDRDDLFGHLTVFERMFATCSFVIDFCIRIKQYYISDVVKYGHVYWAMYFDKFTEEFYEEGGWNELKEVARIYLKIYDFLMFFDEREFHMINMSIEDYYDFMDNDQFDAYKYKLKETHVSKLWIKYRVERLESCMKIPLIYRNFEEALDIEEILENLKFLFDYFSTKPSDSFDMACSKTSDEYDTYLDKLNANEILPTKQLEEASCNKKFLPYSVLDATNFCSEKGVKDSVEEGGIEKILEVNCSPKNTDDQKKIDFRSEIISAIETARSELDGISFSYMPNQQVSDNLYSRNTEIQSATPTARETLSENQTDVSLRYWKPFSYSVPDRTTFSSEKGGSAEEICIEKTFEVNFSSKNRDDLRETVKGKMIISIIDELKSEMDVKSISENFSIPKVPSPENRFENTNGKMEKTEKVREDLRNEQGDSEINIFLRMILVLNDRQGAKILVQALHNNKDGSEKTQVTRNKRKKKSKKNKSKM